MDFQVIPAIDLRDGRCVRLFQGQYDQETVFSEDPVAVARQWEAEGAPMLHLVDLDGALAGVPKNLEVIKRIVKAISIPVEMGGGLRDVPSIQRLLEAGVSRAILGTAAVETPELVKRACRLFDDRIVVALDAKDGIVMTRGWTEASGETAVEVAIKMVKLGVRRLMYTDISRDGTLTEPNWEAGKQLLAEVDIPVVASGGVAKVEQLVRLRNLGFEGAIVGRALYTGDIKMADLRQLGLLPERKDAD
ncbi:MAG TPA: 1-(5-phosphoribosyl)-5-[(5-phosphoribosylamino)methylideneamino]imidazole-4-carboxamide isomerase [Chloroflexota bacterium]|nr:1-(5-phosphoribosyl)-5-[(5-phosphoribosylamino)methylideneamino]imidazole-4-carboxamide isomerase [Chloroflexota bacterium]